MDSGGLSWGLITIVAPILLAVAILWAILRNRKTNRRDFERTEQATRDLYKEEDARTNSRR